MTTNVTPQRPESLTVEQALQQAIAHHQAGQLQEAERLYRAILQTQPNHPDANHNLGVLAMQVKQPAAGLPHFKAALEANPTQGQYWLSYIDALIQTGQTDAARQILAQGRSRGLQGATIEALAGRLEELVGSKPSPQEINTLLTLFNERRYHEAATLAQVLTVRFPLHGFGWKVLGASFKQMGRSVDALANMQKAATLSPNEAEAHSNLGVILQDLGQLDAAVVSYRRALEIKPDFAEAHSNLGNALRDLWQLDDAVASYRRALEIKPDYAEAHSNLGIALRDLGQLDAAVVSYRRALEIKPDYAEAHSNLGNALRNLGKIDAALGSCSHALQIKPDCAEMHVNFGNALKDVGRLDEAEASYRRALSLMPSLYLAHSNLIFILDMHTDRSSADVQEERRRWGAMHAAHVPQIAIYANLKIPKRKLRIGYISADFRVHSAASVFGAMLVDFDSTRFDVIAYTNSSQSDALTQHFKQCVTAWRTIFSQSDDAVADLIRQDEIDILVDLSGHSAGNRLLVFARKPAPIQITAWGYIGGTGMKAMDVFFADPVVVPPEEKTLYTEEVRYFPNVVSAFFLHAFPPVNALPAQSTNGITFASFSRLAKISDEAYRAWAQVLLAVPNSRMVLKTRELTDAGTRVRVMENFTREGIAPERITLLGKTSWHDHVAAFNQIDMTLDPFPHGGGVTTLEGLMMGVPVVTLRWPTLVGRLSASILTTLKLTDWIAETPEQYVEIAVNKARGLESLTELRQQLRALLTSSIIGDTKAYVAEVEREYRTLWREWCDLQN